VDIKGEEDKAKSRQNTFTGIISENSPNLQKNGHSGTGGF
jgi:hypothetical protein